MSNLTLVRLEKGLRQLDLARKVGVSENIISRLETGRKDPDKKLLEKLSKVLGKGFKWKVVHE